ncbi:hypothetical protein HAZT_HAZT005162 [Hyalella azteca]|uniref:small monomeric GTPase n=1 Tax=Hyalella azteca TaxID=294128 RepID=A0A6A0GUJ5_HYAAZ|nr:hypothetical protein HAZT_HAZT005162 [Hyalella azteca]
MVVLQSSGTAVRPWLTESPSCSRCSTLVIKDLGTFNFFADFARRLCRMNNDDDLPGAEILSWADGLLLVYSITDRQSFDWVKRCRLHFTEQGTWPLRLSGSSSPSLSPSPPPLDVSPSTSPPTLLLGNKADMVHLRQVSSEEGMYTFYDIVDIYLSIYSWYLGINLKLENSENIHFL